MTIPYARQHIDDDDVAAVVAVLRGDWLTQGPAVAAFETRLREITGARHAVAFSSGTAALHGAVHAAGVGPGDRVATSALSFVASAACAVYVGAEPVFVDIEESTLNIDLARVPDDVDALIAVHYAGLPVDLTRLEHRPRVVVEDAAHAIGAATPDGPVGCCAHSDLCCFSFHPVKTVTTGEGGAVTTNDDHLAERLRTFRHHGIRPEPTLGAWAYDIAEAGMNYRLTDIQAALGTSQLGKLDRFVRRRNELADRYREVLAEMPVTLPPEPGPGVIHGRHLYPVQVANRRRTFDGLHAAGIAVQVHYVPTHHLTAYRGTTDPADLPVCEAVAERIVSLPLFPDLTLDEQDHVAVVLRELVA